MAVRIEWLWLVPALPLAAAAVNLFAGRRLGQLAGWIASAAVALSFLVSAAAVQGLLGASEDARVATQHLFDWISVGSFTVGA
ncbi:MAG TPA: NADH-quinone oxidoreductase subunit L, partial [Actinomycetes bacterium]|nr:NADH-quinone oxidoreductase subunit L [Actinomycetes bacterium]